MSRSCLDAFAGQLVQLPTTQFNDPNQSFDPGDTIVLTLQVQTKNFCPKWMAIPDSQVDSRWNVVSITGPAGVNLLLGGQPINTEFFSSKNQRGGQVASCCIPAGLTITVTLQTTASFIGGVMFGASFWGVVNAEVPS